MNPLLPSPSGISRCFSFNQPKSAIRCDKTRSRSRSSVVIGRGGTARATCGVNVLPEVIGIECEGKAKKDAQVVKSIHNKLLHSLHGIIEFIV